MDKKSFIFYKAWAEIIKRLPKEDAGELITAICHYQTGTEYKIENPYIEALFEGQMKPQFITDDAKYQEQLKKRSEAGKKGMKARWENITKDNTIITNNNTVITKDNSVKSVITKITDNVNDNDNDNVNDNDKDKSIRQEKPARHAHGEYKHVRLSDKEYQKLIEDYGSTETTDAIKYLDEYIEMKGVKYKNHNLVLRKWVFDAVKEHKPKDDGGDYLLRIIQGGAE